MDALTRPFYYRHCALSPHKSLFFFPRCTAPMAIITFFLLGLKKKLADTCNESEE